jgi:hypothetical protein
MTLPIRGIDHLVLRIRDEHAMEGNTIELKGPPD